MKVLLFLGFLTGLDNLQVMPALGLMPMSAMRRLMLAIVFGLCEALMPLAGLGIGFLLHRSLNLHAEIIGAIALMICGAVILWLVFREKEPESVMESRWTFIGLPLSLSVDNLLAGIGVGAAGFPPLLSAGVLGAVSTAMSLTGLYLGHWLRRFIPGKAEYLSGAYLFLLGLFFLIKSNN